MAEANLDSLLSYRNTILDDIALNAATNGTTDTEEFISFVSDTLIEAEEIDDFYYVPYEGVGRQNKRLQIDGYSYDELNDALCLFVAVPLSYGEDETLTSTEATRYINRVVAFLDNAEFVLLNAEESAPGYGLASDITHMYKDVHKYKVFLFTDRQMSKSITEIANLHARQKPVEVHIWDINRLFLLNQSSSVKEDIVIKFSEFGIEGIPCMLASNTDDYQAYLCNIPGMILAQLYNRYGGRLLEGNVRSFLQVKGKVNKGIRATILNEPNMFFAYNNGIAATAHSLSIEERKGTSYITEITSLQIVNGGQTTASLATALIKDKKDNAEENIKHINVPMKLSVVTPEKASNLISNIARYANSQNKVSDADLWSNHPFHIRLEEFSRRLIAPATNGRQYGTYWYYERANGQYKQETYKSTPKEKERFDRAHPKNQMFTKTDLAKYMLIYQQRPDIASAGGQKAFARFAEWASKEWEKNNTNINEDFFRQTVAIALLFRKADQIVRKQSWYRSYKANIVAYALSKIFYTIETTQPDMSVSFRNIWTKQDLSEAWVKQIESASFLMYQHLVREDRGIENVTEWAKREACWSSAKQIPYELNADFIRELQYKSETDEQKRQAQLDQKLANKLSSMIEVVNYGQDNWKQLLDWNTSHRVLSPSEKHLIQLAADLDGGLITSDKRCSKVMTILEKCRTEGYPG